MKPARGFSLFELAVVVAIIGVLTGMLLSRLTLYQEQAELAAMETTLGILRSSLALRSGQMVAKGQGDQLDKLLTLNPMDLLAQKPSNYAGEYYSPQKAKISPGNWYFNRKKFLLVYIKRTGATPQADNDTRYTYRVELIRSLEDANGPEPAETSRSTTIDGVVLRNVLEPISAAKHFANQP
ncbi:MAG TPA: type II secretion system protein [Telluria sp.]|jgi:general secretion pathway protein G